MTVVDQKKYKTVNFFFVCLVLIEIFVIIFPVSRNIASSSSDDSIFSHIYSCANQELYMNDATAISYCLESTTSLMNLIPRFFYEFIHFPPVLFWILFSFFQIALLPYSIYLLTKQLGFQRYLSYLSAIGILNYRIYEINLSWSGDLMWMPYANWLAMDFAILALNTVLKGSRFWTATWLSISIAIHPGLGLGVLPFIIIVEISRNPKFFRDLKNLILSLVPLILVFFFLIFNWNKFRSLDVPTSEDYASKVVNNWHFNPFLNSFLHIEVTTKSLQFITFFLFFLLFSKLSLTHFSNLPLIFRLTNKSIFLLCGYLLLQGLFLKFQFLALVRLSLHRFSILVAILMCLSIAFITAEFISYKMSRAEGFFWILLFVLFPGTGFLFIFSFRLLVSFRRNLSKVDKLKCYSLFGFVISLNLFVLIHRLGIEEHPWAFIMSLNQYMYFQFNPLFYGESLVIKIVCLGAGCLLLFFFNESITQLNVHRTKLIALGLFLLFCFVGVSDQNQERLSGQNADFYKLILWAREYADPNSIFAFEVGANSFGWRSTLDRPLLEPGYSGGPYGLYAQVSSLNASMPREVNLQDLTLDSGYVNYLREKFDLDYIVIPSGLLSNLDIFAYTNSSFSVININKLLKSI